MTGTEKKSKQESRDLVTGFDEIAVEQTFNKHIEDMRYVDVLRALIWLDYKHGGQDPKAAHTAVLGLTQVQINEHFASDEDDDGGEEGNNEFAMTEVGKDGSDDSSSTPSSEPGASFADSPQTSTEA